MLTFIARYTNWLHTCWPSGRVERLPDVHEDGTTNIPGLRVTGDLTGIPLLKFSSDSGARAVRAILAEPGLRKGNGDPELLDLAIVGGGVSGIAAAMEAKRGGLRFRVLEADAPFSTIANFPKRKPIYTYPRDMTPAGDLQLTAEVKEDLLHELEEARLRAGIEVTRASVERVEKKGDEFRLVHAGGGAVTRARRVIVAIGQSGNFRTLGVPGEELDKVYNRLHDPADFAGREVLVVGGGDSALETAAALAGAGARVTLSYRRAEFSRPKPENVRKLGACAVKLALGTQVLRIDAGAVTLSRDGAEETVPNDVVFTMLGREAPLDFFRRSGIAVRGEWHLRTWIAFASFFLFCALLYLWKGDTALHHAFETHGWFPFAVPRAIAGAARPTTALGALAVSLGDPSFYYGLAYTLVVALFGIRRVRRRRTPYVRAQTWSLFLVQALPLFFLPSIILPLAGSAGWFDHGVGKSVADALFPLVDYGHGRAYWRSTGLILAWPLFLWNVFTDQPLWTWLAVSGVQTFVVIPLIVRRWGKGAYCGWICSCGALAETLGDGHRRKMPHGPFWNRLNMAGQVILLAGFVLLLARVVSWAAPSSTAGSWAHRFYHGLLGGWAPFGFQLNYYHVVDIFLASILAVSLYFWASGRVWCRFACPLAALMHIYARASRFRIFAEKSKCISCNVCTAVCHQGIDVMNFANKGRPMEDPECVRCSACVQMCPTGVLRFGRLGDDGTPAYDRLPASSARLRAGES